MFAADSTWPSTHPRAPAKAKAARGRGVSTLVLAGLSCLGISSTVDCADAQAQQFQLNKSYVDQNRSVNVQIESVKADLQRFKPMQYQNPLLSPLRSIGRSYSYSSTGVGRESDSRSAAPLPQPQPVLVPFGSPDGGRPPTRDAQVVADDILDGIDAEQASTYRAKPPSAGAAFAQTWDSFENAQSDEAAAPAVARARQLAADGSADAMLLIAMAHARGRGAKRDERLAFDWVSRAAQSGNTAGQAMLGELYVIGFGVPSNPARALEWLGKAAESGDVRAGWRYASALLETKVPSGDFARALRYAEAAEATNPQAAFEAGMILFEARPGVPPDNARAVAAFGRAAEAGHAMGQYLYAACLTAGFGVARDPAAAIGWLEKSAAQGLTMARFRLGDAYLFGNGAAADPARALELLQLAAADGNPAAMNDLGLAYVDGLGVTPDLVRAAQHFRKAAELGNSDAQLNLGLAYNLGNGVAQSDREAARWLTLAADAGNSTAQYFTGVMMLGGRDVPVDIPQGVARLRAAASSFPPALNKLCELSIRERSGIFWDSPDFTPTLRAGLDADQSACLYVQAVRLRTGTLGPKDSLQAIALTTRSAEQGFVYAELDLGRQFLGFAGQSSGDERLDALSEARYWLARAADHGSSEADKLMQAQGWR